MANPILNVELVCSLFLVDQGLAEVLAGSCVEAALAVAGSQVVSQCSAPGSRTCAAGTQVTQEDGSVCRLAEEEVMEKQLLGTVCSIGMKRCRKQRDRHHDPKEKGSPSRLWKNLAST